VKNVSSSVKPKAGARASSADSPCGEARDQNDVQIERARRFAFCCDTDVWAPESVQEAQSCSARSTARSS
jgi:hypothetical protein